MKIKIMKIKIMKIIVMYINVLIMIVRNVEDDSKNVEDDIKVIVLKIGYIGVIVRLVSRRGGSLNWT